MTEQIFLFIDKYAFETIYISILTLFVIGLSPINPNRVETAKDTLFVKIRLFLISFIIWSSVFSLIIIYYVLQNTNIKFTEYLEFKIKDYSLWILGTLVLMPIYKMIFVRYYRTWISNILKKLRHEIKSDKQSSIDESLKRFEKIHHYDVDKYIDPDKGCFMGLDEKNKPCYFEWDDIKEYNKEILGATRRGKGVLASLILYQKILKGWTCIFIDPKPDEFIPRVMKKACDNAERKLLIIDLVEGKEGVYAPFRGSTYDNIADRVKSVFKVKQTGQSDDFYKGIEIKLLDHALSTTNRGVKEIYEDLKANRPINKQYPDAETKIEGVFRSLSTRKQINTKLGTTPKKEYDKALLYPATPKNKHVGGISIARLLIDNHVLYIRGDVENVEVRNLTKLLLTEIIQEVKRLKYHKTNHVSIDIDEAKFLMSETLANSLAVNLGFGCDITLQYQAIEDLHSSVEKDIDLKSLAGSIHQNTQIKIIHGGLASETAEYGSDKTGTIVKQVEFSQKITNEKLNSEQFDSDRTLKNIEENLVTINDFLGMSKMKYVVLMPSTKAKVLHSSFINVENYKQYHKMEK